MQHAIYDAAIVTITTHTVRRGGPAIDACELTQRTARESGMSRCIGTFGLSRNIYALLLMPQLRQNGTRGTTSESDESFSVCASRQMLHADWLAVCRGGYKRTTNQYVRSLVGGGWPRKTT